MSSRLRWFDFFQFCRDCGSFVGPAKLPHSGKQRAQDKTTQPSNVAAYRVSDLPIAWLAETARSYRLGGLLFCAAWPLCRLWRFSLRQLGKEALHERRITEPAVVSFGDKREFRIGLKQSCHC